MSRCIEESTDSKQRTCFNGGIGEHVSRHSIFYLNGREVQKIRSLGRGETAATPSVTLMPEDIEKGCKHIPQPPPENTFNFAKDSKVRPA
jgi:hypothetical protein